jgi:hypothetical protein
MESSERREALYPEDGLTLANFKLARTFPRLQCRLAINFKILVVNRKDAINILGNQYINFESRK